MDDIYLKYWQDALQLMEKSFSDVVFETCIKKLEPFYVDDTVFVLKTDMDFFKTTIEQRHLFKITSIIRAVTEKDYTVQIVSPEDFKEKSESDSTKEEILRLSNLRSKFIFESFVRGKSNELAYAAAVAVAEAPGKTTYNPLFIYGGVGLGKTHLMHSIGNYILDETLAAKILYTTSETFTNELITSIRERRNQEFRNKYREIDVLLIDDIQFISDKEGTQEEFFHTFNALHNANKQIVITSDLPPKDLRSIEDRLRSRFTSGLIVDITAPDFETRTAILEKKAEIDHLDIPSDVLQFIAKNVQSNIRDLEGALNKVSAFSKISVKGVTIELAERALVDVLYEKEEKKVTVDVIMEHVAKHYNISVSEIKSKRRTQKVAYARQIAMYLARKMLNLSLPQLGEVFLRDHSTISHGCEKVTFDIENNEALKIELIELENDILR